MQWNHAGIRCDLNRATATDSLYADSSNAGKIPVDTADRLDYSAVSQIVSDQTDTPSAARRTIPKRDISTICPNGTFDGHVSRTCDEDGTAPTSTAKVRVIARPASTA